MNRGIHRLSLAITFASLGIPLLGMEAAAWMPSHNPEADDRALTAANQASGEKVASPEPQTQTSRKKESTPVESRPVAGRGRGQLEIVQVLSVGEGGPKKGGAAKGKGRRNEPEAGVNPEPIPSVVFKVKVHGFAKTLPVRGEGEVRIKVKDLGGIKAQHLVGKRLGMMMQFAGEVTLSPKNENQLVCVGQALVVMKGLPRERTLGHLDFVLVGDRPVHRGGRK